MKYPQTFVLVLLTGVISLAQEKPRVYLQSASHGNTWNSRRDQSIEMAKDFQKDCSTVKVTLSQNNADYTVILNHIEVGLFARDNQLEVANKDGDLLATREKGGIRGSVKGVCEVIMTDWRTHQPSLTPQQPDTPPTPASGPAPTVASIPPVAPPKPSVSVTPVVSPVAPISSDPSVPVAKAVPPVPTETVSENSQKKPSYQCSTYTVDRLGLKNCSKWSTK